MGTTMADRTATRRVCVGAVSGVHGVRGVVRIKSFTETPEAVAAYGPVTDESGDRRFEISVVGRHKGSVLATLSGVRDRAAAAALKGLRLYVERAALPATSEDEYYYEDLVGLTAETADGEPLGKVTAVFDFGAGDVIEVQEADGRSVLLPFTRAVVPTIDVAGGRIVVVPPAGLLDEGDGNDQEGRDDG